MKKLLSLFLAFVMALGILPAGAFAAGTAANDPPPTALNWMPPGLPPGTAETIPWLSMPQRPGPHKRRPFQPGSPLPCWRMGTPA